MSLASQAVFGGDRSQNQDQELLETFTGPAECLCPEEIAGHHGPDLTQGTYVKATPQVKEVYSARMVIQLSRREMSWDQLCAHGHLP